MDACLAEPLHVRPPSASSSIAPGANFERWLTIAFIGVIVIGLCWRVVRYLGHFPIWGDEAMLLLNILDRDYAGLTQHLRFAQVAPLFFLWLERTAILLFGTSEASLHLFPFLAGIATLVIFGLSMRKTFRPVIGGLAVAILAVSYYPVRHSAEVKPYAFDLFFAVAFAALTLGRLRSPDQSRWLAGLLAMTPIAVFSSYPSAFVGGAVSLVLLPSMLRTSWRDRILFAMFNIALLGSFLVHYALVGQQQIDVEEAVRTREFLRTYWKDAFPPDSVLHWPGWLVKVFTGNMLAHPIGGNHFGSSGAFVLVLLGSFALVQTRNWSVLGLCWLPFAFNLVAAILYKYPFGDSARITLHLTPFICILVAHGIWQAISWVRSDDWRNRLHIVFFVFFAIFGVVGLVRDIVKPFKTEHDRQIRILANDIAAATSAFEPTYLMHDRDEELLAEFLWYLRVRPIDLRWRRQFGELDLSVKSCRLIQCAPAQPPTDPGMPLAGWRVIEDTLRDVPPENHEMPTMYCRVVRLVRD